MQKLLHTDRDPSASLEVLNISFADCLRHLTGWTKTCNRCKCETWIKLASPQKSYKSIVLHILS